MIRFIFLLGIPNHVYKTALCRLNKSSMSFTKQSCICLFIGIANNLESILMTIKEWISHWRWRWHYIFHSFIVFSDFEYFFQSYQSVLFFQQNQIKQPSNLLSDINMIDRDSKWNPDNKKQHFALWIVELDKPSKYLYVIKKILI